MEPKSIHSNLSMIVAASENHVIGREGTLPWRLSGDLAHFKRLTLGHHIIMGRKTFESIGRLLPGRTTVIVTTNENLNVPGAVIAHSIEQLAQVIQGDSEPFVVGGATLYRQLLPFARRIYLTRVHTILSGDVTFELNTREWRLGSSNFHARDARNEFDYTTEVYEKIVGGASVNG